jgi:hypothetical protein
MKINSAITAILLLAFCSGSDEQASSASGPVSTSANLGSSASIGTGTVMGGSGGSTGAGAGAGTGTGVGSTGSSKGIGATRPSGLSSKLPHHAPEDRSDHRQGASMTQAAPSMPGK